MDQNKQNDPKQNVEQQDAGREIATEPQAKKIGVKVRSRVKAGSLVWGD